MITDHPIATPGQVESERQLAELCKHPAIERARMAAGGFIRGGYGTEPPAEAWGRFEGMLDEYVNSAISRVLSYGPGKSRFVLINHPPYRRSGVDVPGSRTNADATDITYRMLGVGPEETYRIRVRPTGPLPSYVAFSLVSDNAGTQVVDHVDLDGLPLQSDGSYTFTIGPNPMPNSPRHLASDRFVRFLFVRDYLNDWTVETPVALEAEKLDGPRPWQSRSLDAIVEDAAHCMVREAMVIPYTKCMMSTHPANRLTPPLGAKGIGGHASAVSILGNFALDEDEALVFHWNPADAAYSSISLADWFLWPMDPHKRQTSLSVAQCKKTSDGLIRGIISLRDPELINWLDCGGQSRVLAMIRWQGLPIDPSGGSPIFEVEKMPFSEARQRVTEDMGPLDRAALSEHREARRDAYAGRLGVGDVQLG